MRFIRYSYRHREILIPMVIWLLFVLLHFQFQNTHSIQLLACACWVVGECAIGILHSSIKIFRSLFICIVIFDSKSYRINRFVRSIMEWRCILSVENKTHKYRQRHKQYHRHLSIYNLATDLQCRSNSSRLALCLARILLQFLFSQLISLNR